MMPPAEALEPWVSGAKLPLAGGILLVAVDARRPVELVRLRRVPVCAIVRVECGIGDIHRVRISEVEITKALVVHLRGQFGARVDAAVGAHSRQPAVA